MTYIGVSSRKCLECANNKGHLVILIDGLNVDSEQTAQIASLADGMPEVSNFEHYARIVRKKAAQRELIHTADTLKQRAFEPDADPGNLAARAQIF
jgi:replicative DNA helicase